MTILERYGTVLRCYDNGGKTTDRYTIIPPRWAHDERNSRANGWKSGAGANRYAFDGIAASADPYAPQGFGQTVSGVIPGPHLGKRIKWADLPVDVQRFARDVFPKYAPLQRAAKTRSNKL